MIITKVKYEKLFPVGAYLNEKIGFEADLCTMTNMDTMEKTNEDPKAAIEKLRQLAEEIHKEKFPHLYAEETSIVSAQLVGQRVTSDPFHFNQPRSEEKPPLTQEQALIKLIQEDCTTVSLLERQRKQVERLNVPIVTEAFNNKMKNLKGEHN